MELRHLAAFVAVAEELNFGRAAARLHMAQSPLSRQIRLLEADLGAMLFVRSTRSVDLTPAGAALLGPARRVLAEASVARRAVTVAGLGEVGRISVGFAGASSYSAIPHLTRVVRSALPGIELELRGQMYSGEVLSRIGDGSLDLGFVALPVRDGVATRVVRIEHLDVALPEAHPLAARDSIELAELSGELFVTFPAARGSAIREAMMRACYQAGFTPQIAQEAPDAYNLLTLVGAGVGVGIVVRSARHIHLDQVVFRPIRDPVAPMRIALAWRDGGESAALREVLRVSHAALPTVGLD